MMLPTLTQPEYHRGFMEYERHPSHHPPQSAYHINNQRPAIELPRPLEPRPTHQLHPSLSETSTSRHHQDAFRSPAAAASEYRGQGQSLPGLRDILTPQPAVDRSSTYGANWPAVSAAPRPATHENYYRRPDAHPSMALQPGQGHIGRSHHHLELPILQTSPLPRHPPQSVPVSPYTGYPEARDYAEVRPERIRQHSTTSYLPPNNAPSPYTSGGEDPHYRNHHTSPEGSQSMPLPPGGAETQKKYLGIREIPGEGSFHMYEGGYRIPTHVDGEQVNPAWGLTKANKPRKRLALACLDCREKKIKCEPGANSCLQCEKAKRPCRRAPAQSSGSDGSAPPSWQSSAGSPVRKGASDPVLPPSYEPEIESASKRRSRAEPSPEEAPSKKHRSASPASTADGVTSGFRQPPPVRAPSPAHVSSVVQQKSIEWEEDPYSIDPDMADYLADLCFTHISNTILSIFPRSTFMHWMRTCTDKCQNERMVLYAVLGLGSLFAEEHVRDFGKSCARVASDAVAGQSGNYHMCVVQTRLLVGLYLFAKGRYGLAQEYMGSAVRASTNALLCLNTETGCLDDASSRSHSRYEFSLSPAQLAECKRRTFWSCFTMELYDDSTASSVALQDIFLRLPSIDDDYERGLPSEAPFYNNGIVDSASTILTPSSPVSPMARLVLIIAIWSDVRNFTNRAIHRPDSTYREAYEAQYAETHAQLTGWSTRLPGYLQYNETNLDRSIQGGYAGTFITMHALYHFVLIRLNRYVRHTQMPESMPRNIRHAHYHAQTVLSVMGAVRNARRETLNPSTGRRTNFALVVPFIGQVTMSAIDVVGAGGLDSNIGATLEVIEGGLVCLRELSRYWNSALEQLRECERRYYQIQNVLSRPYKARSGAWLGREWGLKDPLEKEFIQLGHDCIYADDGGGDGYTRTYFDALRDTVREQPSPAGQHVRIA